jgi:predicted O-methyltransferase YrrM
VVLISVSDIGDSQRAAVDAVRGLPGWMLDEDALKLYELAYSSDGPILEIGTYRGKSAVLMAMALRDAGRAGPVVSLDVDAEALAVARLLADERGLADRVALVRGTAEALFRSLPALRPGLVFLDGDHSKRGVARDLRALENHVPSGGLLLFHDYHDARNADPAEPDYGVVEAVDESWVPRECEFVGVFGCSALFRRRNGANGRGGGDPPPAGTITDLGREPLDSWLARRVLGAAARRLPAPLARLMS